MRACIAFRLTVSPHVGPTVEMLTSFTSTPAYFASAIATFSDGALGQRLGS